MKDSPLPILIILIIILGLAYEPIKKADHTSGRPTNSGSSIGNGSQSLGYSSNKELAENIKDVEENLERLEQNIQKQIAETKRSPYYNKIRMSGVSGIYGDDPNREFIELYTNLEKNETINITGWYFKSEVLNQEFNLTKSSLYTATKYKALQKCPR
jgi:inorganic pyrophosphatase